MPLVMLSLGMLLGACDVGFLSLRRTTSLPPRASPAATAFLFKSALDSGRIADALRLLATADGAPLLADDRYELAPDIERLVRLLAGLPITHVRIDTPETTRAFVWLEVDHLHTLYFTLRYQDSLWVITALERIPWRRPAIRVFPPPIE
ncbi:MAG: hypothetical protein NZ473_06760 [Candidatus Kapabacteria bacterium]|nr:hypothetical protein [Candidatus Kapabacteria bacterium]MCS7170566.1 hypothetical protein [Candidatus Kapabacteria bacterium]MDW7997707.1 hypothetical protein [Bacteroidota bacterium]MDW8225953.1 hypothetical protein [Bacteroidota bacterium]